MEERYKYSYYGWQFTLYNNGTILIVLNGENRLYDIGEVVKVEQENDYVFLYHSNGDFTQVKFEEGNFLVIDKFTSEGEFIDSVGSWVFGEMFIVH